MKNKTDYHSVKRCPEQCSHLANTRAATSYYMVFYSQSGKIKVYILSFQSLFDDIHQGKYVL